VRHDQTGTAFGLAASIQNICLSIVPLLVGYITYTITLILYAFICPLVIYRWLKDTGYNDNHVEGLFSLFAALALLVVRGAHSHRLIDIWTSALLCYVVNSYCYYNMLTRVMHQVVSIVYHLRM
jgi:hypothetical protein